MHQVDLSCARLGSRLLKIGGDGSPVRGNPDDPEPGSVIWTDQITHAVEFDILP